jgi:thiol:disulfide interchange protein DsbD
VIAILLWLGRFAENAPASATTPLKTSANFVKVTHQLSANKARPGESIEVTVLMDITPGWHVQAARPSFEYLVPTKLVLTPEEGIQVSPVTYPTPRKVRFITDIVEVFDGQTPLRFTMTLPRSVSNGAHILKGKLTVQACDDKSCLAPGVINVPIPFEVTGEGTTPAATIPSDGGSRFITFLKAILGAFVGGLILNLMPCVLPVIALKIVGFVAQGNESPAQVRRLGWIFALGVLVSFWLLAALVIGVQVAGRQIGWGFQFQDARFVLAMAFIVTAIALNFFGVFEIYLSEKAMGAAGGLASRTGGSGAFFNGVLATALATPCTAPFLGAALGYAFAQTALVVIAIFTAVGVGLALPYVVLAWNPRLLAWLPKPGPWLLRFKQAMGFPMLATALWLVWILSNSYGTYAMLLVSGWLLAGAFVVWLVSALTEGRFAWVIASLVAIALAGVFWVSPSLSKNRNPRTSAAHPGSLIEWQPYSNESLASALKTQRPVFVDFTADWCLTCQVNKRTSLEIVSVAQRFKELQVLPLLADWTQPNNDITEALRSFGRSGVPAYVVYPVDRSKPPIVLPEVLTPQIVLDALAKAAGGS